jgi:hypothetical protein
MKAITFTIFMIYLGLMSHAAAADNVSETPMETAAGSNVEDIELLKRQLSAQQAINQQLRNRVEMLEQQLALNDETGTQVMLSLDANAETPPVDSKSEDAITAIDEALVSKGLVLIPTGAFRLTPSVSWNHNGTGSDRRDTYVAGLTMEAGLPWGMAASVRVPYVYRDYDFGSNEGLGDISLGLSKRINNETEYLPSFVARLGYNHDNGKDAFDPISVGSGFRSWSASLSAVKRFDPIVVYGGISYESAWDERATLRFQDGTQYFKGKIDPGKVYGLNAGISLAATPEISVDAGLSFSFVDETRLKDDSGFSVKTDRRNVGYITLGSAFLLARNLSLSINAGAGVTEDASDFILSVALPYRF